MDVFKLFNINKLMKKVRTVMEEYLAYKIDRNPDIAN